MAGFLGCELRLRMATSHEGERISELLFVNPEKTSRIFKSHSLISAGQKTLAQRGRKIDPSLYTSPNSALLRNPPVPTSPRLPPAQVHTCTPQPCLHQRTPQSDLQEVKKLPLTASPKSESFPTPSSCIVQGGRSEGTPPSGGIIRELHPGA